MPGFVHIVDDDASFRTAMERRLKQAGYEVATYPSALHLLVNLPTESIPSCILLDVRIPGLDGPALQKRLGELGSTLPIIFLTGYPDIPATVQAIKAGADDFLTKPVTSDDLFRAIEKAFAHHQTLTRSEGQTGQRARPSRAIDAARAAGLRPCRSRQYQQADRPRVGLYRTHHQGPSPQGDGENAGSDLGGACIPCRAGRRCVGYRTDSLGNLSTSLALLLFRWDNRKFVVRGIRIGDGIRTVCGPLAASGCLGRTGQGCRICQIETSF